MRQERHERDKIEEGEKEIGKKDELEERKMSEGMREKRRERGKKGM